MLVTKETHAQHSRPAGSEGAKRVPAAATGNARDYRADFYGRYQSAFKRQQERAGDDAWRDGKLVPLIRDWCRPLRRDDPCIDLGCGDGRLLHALRTLGFTRLAGVDASSEQIALARRVAPEAAVGDLFEALADFPENHFGLVTLFDVIEHLRKDEILRCASLIHRKLKPGGVWLCHLPNGDSPLVGAVQAGDFTHETLLNPRSAQNLCAVAGFTGFEAREHLGASRSLAGTARAVAWRCVRLTIQGWNLIETGSPGSGIFTRCFAFKAGKAA